MNQMAGQQQPRKGWVKRSDDKQMARLTKHVRRAATSRWSRVCRWQVNMISGRQGWTIGLAMVAIVVGIVQFEAYVLGKTLADTMMVPMFF